MSNLLTLLVLILKYIRILKDSKRRVLETAHEAFIDPNNKTVDPEYDVHAAKFPEVLPWSWDPIH